MLFLEIKVCSIYPGKPSDSNLVGGSWFSSLLFLGLGNRLDFCSEKLKNSCCLDIEHGNLKRHGELNFWWNRFNFMFFCVRSFVCVSTCDKTFCRILTWTQDHAAKLMKHVVLQMVMITQNWLFSNNNAGACTKEGRKGSCFQFFQRKDHRMVLFLPVQSQDFSFRIQTWLSEVRTLRTQTPAFARSHPAWERFRILQVIILCVRNWVPTCVQRWGTSIGFYADESRERKLNELKGMQKLCTFPREIENEYFKLTG